MVKTSFVTLFLASFIVLYSLNTIANFSPLGIYNEDNRNEVFQSSPLEQKISKSVGAIMLKSNIISSSSSFDIQSSSYGERHNLCKDERFYSQPAPMNCTGFLITDRLLATAGHCAKENLCPQFAVVFGYGYYSSLIQPENINHKPPEDIYFCKRVLTQVKNDNIDFGVIELDRPVLGREPLKLASSSDVSKNDEFVTLGFPLGLPLKVTDQGKLRDNNTQKGYFVTDLDSFGANSGSPVFKKNSSDVVGILVRGESDFEWDNSKNCRAIKKCLDNDCKGEEVTRIDYLKKFFQRSTSVGSITGCSGVLWNPGGSQSQKALFLTNGHCAGRIPPGETWTQVKKIKEVVFQSYVQRGPLVVQTTELKFGTMSSVDLAVFELELTYDELSTQGIYGLEVLSEEIEAGTPIERLYFDKKVMTQSCRIGEIIPTLKESKWTWNHVYRHDCESWAGTSGSPLLFYGQIAALHSTANENGETCTENNPCEIDRNGQQRVIFGQAYAQNIRWITSCLDKNNQFDSKLCTIQKSIP